MKKIVYVICIVLLVVTAQATHGANSVVRANELGLHTSMWAVTDKQTLRFTAPAANSYNIHVTFSGITYNNILNMSVSIELIGVEIFTDILNGFIGSTTFSIPASGTKSTTSYLNTLFLATGDTLDIIKFNTGLNDPSINTAVGVEAIITVVQLYPDLNNDGIIDILANRAEKGARDSVF